MWIIGLVVTWLLSIIAWEIVNYDGKEENITSINLIKYYRIVFISCDKTDKKYWLGMNMALSAHITLIVRSFPLSYWLVLIALRLIGFYLKIAEASENRIKIEFNCNIINWCLMKQAPTKNND